VIRFGGASEMKGVTGVTRDLDRSFPNMGGILLFDWFEAIYNQIMTSEQSTFSASGQEVIARTIEVDADRTAPLLSSPEEFREFYEIDRTAEGIIRGGFKRVGRFHLLFILNHG
jgi:hypothetical protein